MVLHKLFDDHVLDDIRSIYKDLNTLLVQRSILPKIRYGMARRSGGMGAHAALRQRQPSWRIWRPPRPQRAPTPQRPETRTCSRCCRT